MIHSTFYIDWIVFHCSLLKRMKILCIATLCMQSSTTLGRYSRPWFIPLNIVFHYLILSWSSGALRTGIRFVGRLGIYSLTVINLRNKLRVLSCASIHLVYVYDCDLIRVCCWGLNCFATTLECSLNPMRFYLVFLFFFGTVVWETKIHVRLGGVIFLTFNLVY